MIEIQSDVRDFFQWDIDEDLQSATDMAKNSQTFLWLRKMAREV